MKIKTTIRNFATLTMFAMVSIAFQGCEKLLDEENKSQLSSDNLLSSVQGLETVMADAYSQLGRAPNVRDLIKREEMTTDILWQTGGGENGTAVSLINFFWDSNNWLEAFDWATYWNAIRDVNTILDNVNNLIDVSDDKRSMLIAEARFLRAWAYYSLWNQYGAMPIRTSLDSPRELARASEEAFAAFIETELKEVIPALPDPGKEPNYGRVHSDGARALLCKWYLNNKQWDACNQIAQEIIDRNHFALYPSVVDLFALQNERNTEFMLVIPALANAENGNNMLATSLPPDFYRGIDGGLDGIINTSWSNFASQYRLYDEFYHSFETGDARRDRILTKYVQGNGLEVDLLKSKDNTRGIKFPPDPGTQGTFHGNDFPFIRYADILLAKAEALNEMDGPNQVSLDLINQIRNRANLTENLKMESFADKDALREQILKERRWEFWYEGKRRRDLLRMDKYIENARSRGIDAQEKHKLFPVPQSEIDANPLFEQNPGY
ncbi:RagB/SusD family nutrient uptake outer membrane protein [Olivibacter domesticus]|uniref:Starch-binding associating with outer membrane n=1 Tax=Olivibacter domesticus TaxID=407022 RepID=A0A1H7GD92_OLID1|nr:RagB/SusD family nutrient uptake outer membrane protein [Olivibacter domesticus]SEK36119.1 Starch-binding associating with outer membrane [Olivibacter domesticus]